MSDIDTNGTDTVAELTEEDKQEIKNFLIAIYTERMVTGWQITPQIAALVEDMIRLMDNCNSARDFVPTSPRSITRPGIKYVKKQLAKIVKKTTDRNVFQISEHYTECMNYIRLNFKTHVALAGMGG